MATVNLTISGESQEVIAVIRALASGHRAAGKPSAGDEPVGDAVEEQPPPAVPDREHTWTEASARDTRGNVSQDAQRLLDALIRAPDHQLHIDDIYSELQLDRYGLIGARRSISAALRRNPDTAEVALLTTRDRRVTLDSAYAQVMLSDNVPINPMSRWGQLPQYT
ncbi:MAG: hypothetical protein J4G13_06295 [Dehalococcoidia bacterium]|nr:hypothetical protein [Dehalococcoidia bacterium]